MEKYKIKIKHDNSLFDGDNNSIQLTMFKYNSENFNEIINSSLDGLDDEIDEKKLKDLEDRINNYFNLYTPDDEEFKEFIKIITIYLVFIAKKPLHPLGIKFSNGKPVYEKGSIYYCTGKSDYIKEELSLCKYCIAR